MEKRRKDGGGLADKMGKVKAAVAVTSSAKSRSEMETLFEEVLLRSGGGEEGGLGYQGLDCLGEAFEVPKGDVLLLMLVWKLRCMGSGVVSKAEWLAGMQQHKIVTHSHLRSFLGRLRDETYGSDAAFTSFYSYLYDFLRPDPTRLLPFSIALEKWGILLKANFRYLNLWLEFMATPLAGELTANGVTRDLWKQLLVFALSVDALQDHDREGAFPVII
eukprot:Rhum_TRINITY_DN24070_c0_g1::Rhum_TRINITY_DN24070_c0_g1_i1::g.179237::m.179237/K17822/DCUN1D1_2; DCN1-like protein 1/2